jgi:hypothetical protein
MNQLKKVSLKQNGLSFSRNEDRSNHPLAVIENSSPESVQDLQMKKDVSANGIA